MRLTIGCVRCPRGCDIETEVEGGLLVSIEGAACSKGLAFVDEEIVDPRRTVSSSILVLGGEEPLVSLRSTKAIPKARIFDLIDEIRKARVEAPVSIGQVLVENVLGLGCDLIATREVLAAASPRRTTP